MKIWLLIAAIAAGTYALKAAGPLLFGGRELPDSWRRASLLVAVAMLSALAAVQMLQSPSGVQLDARSAGVAAAVVATALKAPLWLAVAVAAAVAACLRL